VQQANERWTHLRGVLRRLRGTNEEKYR
jgi:hypothetical protein